jgi:hypothetical protein
MEIAVVERWAKKRLAARILAGGDFEGAVKPLTLCGPRLPLASFFP